MTIKSAEHFAYPGEDEARKRTDTTTADVGIEKRARKFYDRCGEDCCKIDLPDFQDFIDAFTEQDRASRKAGMMRAIYLVETYGYRGCDDVRKEICKIIEKEAEGL